MSRLEQIQITTQQVAEAISSVLGMDVTIVDDAMVRTAGTGCHRDTIGRKIVGHFVYRQVVEEAREFFIGDVRTNENCGECEKYPTCNELAQLCCPIVLGRETIGVIGLIAFSPEQKRTLIDKGEELLIFIRKMAELISAKVVEKSSLDRLTFMKNQLETVLNFVAEGIIAIDRQAHIVSINDAAEKLLRVKAGDVRGFHIGEIFPGTPIAEVLRDGRGFINREVKIWRNGRQFHYFINAQPMLEGGAVEGVVASFRAAAHWRSDQAARVKTTFDDLIGDSAVFAAAKEEALKAASGNTTVLIRGESGTGKELFARAVHNASERSGGPFIAVNCAAIPENLLESELFGYEEGSFTGAKKGGKPGKFQLAGGGTLFLDEIGDMPLALQAKILRALQEKTIERVGATKAVAVDVRVIAATHRNLEAMVRGDKFREDLYYRLNVFPLQLPPLRQRPGDILPLATAFLQKLAKEYNKKIGGFSAAAVACLQGYRWPGNIRELENTVERAVIKASGFKIAAEDLSIQPEALVSEPVKNGSGNTELRALRAALQACGPTVAGKRQAAARLGISIATLYRKLRKYKTEL